MISIAYINGYNENSILSNPLFAIESALSSIDKECETDLNEYYESLKQNEFLEFIGEATNDEKKTNIFEKVGNAIIKIGQEFVKFINTILSSFKDRSFQSKSDIEKIEKYCKEHPEFKDDIKYKFTEGELDVSMAKNLDEIQKSYEELVKFTTQQSNSTSACRKKLAQFKEKCETIDKSAVVKTAGAAATVIGLGVAIYKFKSAVVKYPGEVNAAKKAQGDYERLAKDGIKILEHMGETEYTRGDYLTRAQILQNGYSAATGATSKMVSNSEIGNRKMVKFLHDIAVKLSNSKIDKVADVATKQLRKNEHDQDSLRSEIVKDYAMKKVADRLKN